MKLVKIQDIQAGDEIIIATNCGFKFLKVLITPRLGKRLHWHTKVPLYKSVKCSTRMEEKTTMYGIRAYIKKEYVPTFEDHNVNIYQGLEYKDIMLINPNR